jgi:hypothetical protein
VLAALKFVGLCELAAPKIPPDCSAPLDPEVEARAFPQGT